MPLLRGTLLTVKLWSTADVIVTKVRALVTLGREVVVRRDIWASGNIPFTNLGGEYRDLYYSKSLNWIHIHMCICMHKYFVCVCYVYKTQLLNEKMNKCSTKEWITILKRGTEPPTCSSNIQARCHGLMNSGRSWQLPNHLLLSSSKWDKKLVALSTACSHCLNINPLFEKDTGYSVQQVQVAISAHQHGPYCPLHWQVTEDQNGQ